MHSVAFVVPLPAGSAGTLSELFGTSVEPRLDIFKPSRVWCFVADGVDLSEAMPY